MGDGPVFSAVPTPRPKLLIIGASSQFGSQRFHIPTVCLTTDVHQKYLSQQSSERLCTTSGSRGYTCSLSHRRFTPTHTHALLWVWVLKCIVGYLSSTKLDGRVVTSGDQSPAGSPLRPLGRIRSPGPRNRQQTCRRPRVLSAVSGFGGSSGVVSVWRVAKPPTCDTASQCSVAACLVLTAPSPGP